MKDGNYKDKDYIEKSIPKDVLLYVEESMCITIMEQIAIHNYLIKEWCYASDYKICRDKSEILISVKNILNEYNYNVGDYIRIYNNNDLVFDFKIASLDTELEFDVGIGKICIDDITILVSNLSARGWRDLDSFGEASYILNNNFYVKSNDLQSLKVIVNNNVICEISNEDIKLQERSHYFN